MVLGRSAGDIVASAATKRRSLSVDRSCQTCAGRRADRKCDGYRDVVGAPFHEKTDSIARIVRLATKRNTVTEIVVRGQH